MCFRHCWFNGANLLALIVPSLTSMESFTFRGRCWMWNAPVSYEDAEISVCRRFCFSFFLPVTVCTLREMLPISSALKWFSYSSAEMAAVYLLGCCRQPQKWTQLVQQSFGLCLWDITALVERDWSDCAQKAKEVFFPPSVAGFNIAFCSMLACSSKSSGM